MSERFSLFSRVEKTKKKSTEAAKKERNKTVKRSTKSTKESSFLLLPGISSFSETIPHSSLWYHIWSQVVKHWLARSSGFKEIYSSLQKSNCSVSKQYILPEKNYYILFLVIKKH